MTVNEVYNHLGNFLLGLLPDSEWIKAELSVEIQPGYLGMSGECVTTDETISLRTKYSQELKEEIRWLHEVSTEGARTNGIKQNLQFFRISSFRWILLGMKIGKIESIRTIRKLK
jgi:hypothetical protein